MLRELRLNVVISSAAATDDDIVPTAQLRGVIGEHRESMSSSSARWNVPASVRYDPEHAFHAILIRSSHEIFVNDSPILPSTPRGPYAP